MIKKRGRNAAHSGTQGESQFEGSIRSCGIEVMDYRAWSATRQTPCCVRQFPVPHPYRGIDSPRAGKNDFMMFVNSRRTVYVQVKHQRTSGTTDEKLAFALDIARFSLGTVSWTDFWLVLLGEWWPQREGLIDYAERKASEMEYLAASNGHKIHARVLVGNIALGQAISDLNWSTRDTTFRLQNK